MQPRCAEGFPSVRDFVEVVRRSRWRNYTRAMWVKLAGLEVFASQRLAAFGCRRRRDAAPRIRLCPCAIL